MSKKISLKELNMRWTKKTTLGVAEKVERLFRVAGELASELDMLYSAGVISKSQLTRWRRKLQNMRTNAAKLHHLLISRANKIKLRKS